MLPYPGFKNVVTVVFGGEIKIASGFSTPTGLSPLSAIEAHNMEVADIGNCTWGTGKFTRDTSIILIYTA